MRQLLLLSLFHMFGALSLLLSYFIVPLPAIALLPFAKVNSGTVLVTVAVLLTTLALSASC